MDVLCEAATALDAAHSRETWDAAEKAGAENSVGDLARKAANARHAENRQRAELIKAAYKEQRANYRSMDAAAEALSRQFAVAFRTARDHIAAAAKELRSAGKA